MPDDATRIRRLEEEVKDDREQLHGRINKLGDEFNASMGKVDKTLTRIETILGESVVKRIEGTEDDIEKIEIMINGNDEKPGIKGQIDRLNQWSGTVKWAMGGIAAAVGGLVVQEVWKRFML